MQDDLQAQIDAHVDLVLSGRTAMVRAAIDIGMTIAATFREGGRLFIFGNGGSAADAQHMAAEFLNRYALERPPLPALALTTDSSTLTAIANDYDFRDVFAKQLRALAAPGDLALGITTSGNSQNVLEGLRVARQLHLKTAALLGRDGGEARQLVDMAYVVPHDDTPRIQEAHLILEHMICAVVEHALFRAPARPTAR